MTTQQTWDEARAELVEPVAARMLAELYDLTGIEPGRPMAEYDALQWATEQGGLFAEAAEAYRSDDWYYQPRTGAALLARPRKLAEVIRRMQAILPR